MCALSGNTVAIKNCCSGVGGKRDKVEDKSVRVVCDGSFNSPTRFLVHSPERRNEGKEERRRGRKTEKERRKNQKRERKIDY